MLDDIKKAVHNIYGDASEDDYYTIRNAVDKLMIIKNIIKDDNIDDDFKILKISALFTLED